MMGSASAQRLSASGVMLLLLVLLSAGVVRFPATQRGFIHWDEAQYLFGVQPAVLTLREALGINDWPRPFAERAPFDREKAPYFAFSAKPGYDLILILYGVFVGLTPESAGLLSLLFGLGTLLVLHRLTREVFDDRVALAAVSIHVVSAYHVFYSGSQSPAVMATFFLLLGVFVYLWAANSSSLPGVALAGATLAYAYGCHNNLLLYVVMIFGVHALRLAIVPQTGGIRSFLVMGLSFFSVIVIFDLFYRLLIGLAYGHLSEGRGAYLAQLRYAMGFFKWAIPSGAERFPMLLLDSEGWLVLGLAMLGLALSVRQVLHDWSQAILLVLPVAYCTAAIYAGFSGSPVFSRMIVTILPFVALWGGVGVVRLAESLGSQLRWRFATSVVMVTGIALVLVVGLPRAWAVAHLKAGYEKSARYVLAHGGQQVTLGLPVDQYYLGSFHGTHALPTSVEALRALKNRTNVDLLVLDYRVNILEEWGHPLGPALREFERTHKPMAMIANPPDATLLLVAENAMSRDALARTLADPRTGQIRIYNLDEFLGDS